jgi:hypothetical protein
MKTIKRTLIASSTSLQGITKLVQKYLKSKNWILVAAKDLTPNPPKNAWWIQEHNGANAEYIQPNYAVYKSKGIFKFVWEA